MKNLIIRIGAWSYFHRIDFMAVEDNYKSFLLILKI